MTSTASVPPQIEKPAFGKFFLPGPTDVHPDVLEAMIHPMIGHRSSAMEKLLQGMAPRLSALARTARPVFVGTTSATGFMEMAVRNGVRRRALSRAGRCIRAVDPTREDARGTRRVLRRDRLSHRDNQVPADQHAGHLTAVRTRRAARADRARGPHRGTLETTRCHAPVCRSVGECAWRAVPAAR